MAALKLFFVQLRRPHRASTNPDERRDDPFYEFGSFGCTGCHSSNLLHPRNADNLAGGRLAFVQGGPLGSRLVLLTPPVTVRKYQDRCEVKWKPAEMPFRYERAPVLAWNSGRSHFPLVEQFAAKTRRRTIEGGLSSRLRTLKREASTGMANQIIRTYERLRRASGEDAVALTYVEALPHDPPVIDVHRRVTYRRLRELANLPLIEADRAHLGARSKARSTCMPRCRPRVCRTTRCL